MRPTIDSAVEAFDLGPPRDLDIEAKVIACLFLQQPGPRAQLASRLSQDDFYDPLNVWLFRAIRVFSHLDGVELFRRIEQFPNNPVPELSVTAAIALAIQRRDGQSRVNFALMPVYVETLKAISDRRTKFDQHIAGIQQACQRPDYGPGSDVVFGSTR